MMRASRLSHRIVVEKLGQCLFGWSAAVKGTLRAFRVGALITGRVLTSTMARYFSEWLARRLDRRQLRSVVRSLQVRQGFRVLRVRLATWRLNVGSGAAAAAPLGEGKGVMPWKKLEVLKMMAGGGGEGSPARSTRADDDHEAMAQDAAAEAHSLRALATFVGGRERRNLLSKCLVAWEAAVERG